MPRSHTLTGIALAGRVVHGSKPRAPGDSEMANWGKLKKVDIVTRYYPTRKGWLLLDIRDAFPVGHAAGQRWWRGVVRHDRIYPSLDAAIMHAMVILAG